MKFHTDIFHIKSLNNVFKADQLLNNYKHLLGDLLIIKNKLSKALLIFITLSCFSGSIYSQISPGTAPVKIPTGGFGIDGDLTSNDPTTGIGDWVPGSAGSGGHVLTSAGVPLNGSTTFHRIDAYLNPDDNFKSGEKFFDDPNTWEWVTNPLPSKNNVNNVLVHVGHSATGDLWITVAGDRESPSGANYIDFEFLQNTLTQVGVGSGTFISSGPHGGRTIGDFIISAGISGGVDFQFWRWEEVSPGVYDYIDKTNLIPAGAVFGALNTVTIPVSYGAFGSTPGSLPPSTFIEVSVNISVVLNLFGGGFNTCTDLGINTVMIKTKTSPSPTATIVDIVSPFPVNLTSSDVNAGPDQSECFPNVFALNGTATAGTDDVILSTTWSVVSGVATISSPNTLSTNATVTGSSATLQLTITTENSCTLRDTIVLTVLTKPNAGPDQNVNCVVVLPGGSATMAALSAGTWSAQVGNPGTATITAPGSPNTTITNFSAYGKYNFIYTGANGCTDTASVFVNQDLTPPGITCPANITLYASPTCTYDTTLANTGSPIISDNCPGVTFRRSDNLAGLTGCSGTGTFVRTFTATDSTGNTNSCQQSIRLIDSTRPIITCPGNVTLNCPATDTTIAATGNATATDACDGTPTITHTNSNTPGACAGTYTTIRTFTATDDCGNTSTCNQTVLVQDTTRPTITCPGNVTLNCPATDTTIAATGNATATDACDGTPTITHTNNNTPGTCAGTYTTIRTFRATDDCGNTNTCSQTILVQDTTRPTITCPANVTLNCPATDTTIAATGNATATDLCDGTPTITHINNNTPGACAGTYTTIRTFTATDDCGNSSSCTQIISVQDTSKPTITCPPDITIYCAESTDTSNTGSAIATDNCTVPITNITYTDFNIAGICNGINAILRRWVAVDGCENLDSCTQIITIFKPEINIVKTGVWNDTNNDGNADAGETISYSFKVCNTGNVTLTNVSVTDPLFTVIGGPITLAAGACDSTTFSGTYVILQSDVNAGVRLNTATATGDDPQGVDVTDTDDETVTLPKSASINLVKSGVW
ncbi:MAG: hypothetical protein M3Q56_02005, partial [Bacteroidota bacterium]|nr:hypothetical protein [Bacteroidota bacterium]